jgi:chemotaxis protein MotA
MRTSVSNIFCFFIALGIMIWGALLVVGYSTFNVIPSGYEILNLPSLAIVFGGILASVFISYPFKKVVKALRNSLRLFSQTKITDQQLEEDIEKILDWQRMIKENKMDAVAELNERYDGEFAGYLFSLMDTNYTAEELRELGEAYIQEDYSRQQRVNEVITSMGKASPVFGMLGTLFGLIVILSGFNELEALLSGLGAALMTTFYGILIGNFIFNPVARKMKNIASLQYFRKKLILEGVLLIQKQQSSLKIYDKLRAHMQRSEVQV